MTDKSVYGGLFEDPPYLSSDPDPKKTDFYEKRDFIPSKYLGKNMATGGPIVPGQYPDAFFDKKYLTLASSEQNGGKPVGYDDSKFLAAEAAYRSKTKIADAEFRYSSYPQKSTGPGSFYGCFQNKPFEYMTEPWDDGSKKKKRKKKPEPVVNEEASHLPNIKTSRTKKGTYGFPGLLLSNEPYNDNWRADMDTADREAAKRQRGQRPPPQQLGPPLHISGVSKTYVDELPNTGVSAVYAAYTPPEETSKKKRRKGKAAAAEPPGSIHERAFYSGSRPDGDRGCINAFPNTWMDPTVEVKLTKRQKKRQAAAAAMVPQRPKGAGEWLPNSFEKTSVISSCLRRFY